MRTSWWACICVGIVAAVMYHHFNRPSLPTESPATSAQSGQHPLDQQAEQPLAPKDEERLQDAASTPADSEPDPLPNTQKEARLEDATGAIARSEPNDTKQNLSYLAYYAYSEIPPETKPADIVLNSLKSIPPGTPVEE